MAGDPITASAVAAPAITKAIEGIGASLSKQIGRVTKPIVDRAIADLGIGLRSYLDASYNRCRYFKTILNQVQPLEVTQYYVNNTLSCGNVDITDTELIDKLTNYRHIIVTGLAGSGKSMFMKYLTVCRFENPRGYIPLFVELRQLNSITQKDLIEFIRASCTGQGYSITADQFKLALAAGTFIIILDGFDELNHEFRDDISKQILNLCQKYPDLTIVISSRHDERFGGWAPFHVFNVDAMTKKQTLQLISTLEYDPGVKKRFYKEVNSRLYDSHTSFLSSPLLTTIMLLTYEEFAEIPVKMHSFYSQAFDTLFQKHDASKEQYQRKTHTSLTREDFRSTFSAFCAMSYLDQKFSFTDDEVSETANSALKYVRQSGLEVAKPITAKSLIDDLKESVCLLQQDGLETAFVHRSFQEYFAALFATSLHGEKLRKVLDKYALRFGDSVVSMTMDMARESVEQEWVLPTTQTLEDVFKLGDNTLTLADRLRCAFTQLDFYRTPEHVYSSFGQLKTDILGPLETLSYLYPDQIGLGHIISPLRFDVKQNLPFFTDPNNQGKAAYDEFYRLLTRSDNKPRRVTRVRINFEEDNDWWLRHLGLDIAFQKLAKGLPAIRRDIALRAKKRRVILDDFL